MKKKVLSLLAITVLILAFTACGDDVSKDDAATDVPKVEKTIDVTDPMSLPAFTAGQNTTEMVDQIGATANDYADKLTDSQADQIIAAIRVADHNFYNGPEEMEKYMWYGHLLDAKYDDSDARSLLGADLVQAIKYVYRGSESVLDDSTHENLLQIDKDLSEIK